MPKNKLIIASAGSGKTTFLINEALDIEDDNVLITTYTEANEAEIKKKIIEVRGCIPANISVQTWFSFLLQHGVRPFQSVLSPYLAEKKIGFYLTERPSGFKYMNQYGQPVYWGEADFLKYYFTNDLKIYSDKIAKFVYEVNSETGGELFKRISRIFKYIFIDEIQDLAGWELELINILFNSDSSILLVGDPRQVTYLTHHPRKFQKYKDGKIKEYILQECRKDICEIDEKSLTKSHRNNSRICEFSSKLFPEYEKSEPCNCTECRGCSTDKDGIFLVKEKDIGNYIESYKPTIMRWDGAVIPEWNFGKSKGLTFDNVLIHPTEPIMEWLKDNSCNLSPISRSKFYVAITRARHSVGIICDEELTISGVNNY